MAKYSLGKALPILIFLAAVVAVIYFMSDARATGKKPPPIGYTVEQQQRMDQKQQQKQGQKQKQQQSQEANSHSESVANSDSSANNEGNNLSVNSESGPADIVLIPQGHTSNCMRTYGLSFGNREGGGGIGWPYRDKSCDFSQNAAAADLQGNYDLGWFWRCQKKNSYKVFKVEGGTNEAAIEDCVARNSGPNFMSDLIDKQKAEIAQVKKERDAGLLIIQERDREALRLKQEVSEKRLVEAVSK